MQANGIHQVLEDGHGELGSLQNQMRTAVQVDAPQLGVRGEDIGGGKVRCFFPHVRGDTDERTRKQLDDKQVRELNELLRFNSAERNGEFATEFYRGLGGPKQAPQFYAERSIDGTGNVSPWSRPEVWAPGPRCAMSRSTRTPCWTSAASASTPATQRGTCCTVDSRFRSRVRAR